MNLPTTTVASAADEGAVARALAAAVSDAGRIVDLLDVLKTARLYLPLPDDGTPVITGTAVTLPTVSYLGNDFIPAYSSAALLRELSGQDRAAAPGSEVPHAVVRAADLARLLPPTIGIALNAGASESVPVYPPGVAYLAEDAEAGAAGAGGTGTGGADAGAARTGAARTHERARLRLRRRPRVG